MAPEPTMEQLIERAKKTGTTGRMLVFMPSDRHMAAAAAVAGPGGWPLLAAAAPGGGAPAAPNPSAHSLPALKVAIVPEGQAQQLRASVASATGSAPIMRPERLVRVARPADPGAAPPVAPSPHGLQGGNGLQGVPTFGLPGGPPFAVPVQPGMPPVGFTTPVFPPEYWVGYRDGVGDVVSRLSGLPGGIAIATPFGVQQASRAAGGQGFSDTSDATWGLQAIGAADSRFSGRGVRVAILDTGIDLGHPDFVGRVSQSRDFIGQGVQDNFGHGTHCAGIACGPQSPNGPVPRYGVAYNAELFVGKVLSNEGAGIEGAILDGIQWAIDQGCRVVSMSFEAPGPGQDPSYNGVGDNALAHNTLLIAAAGNESQRPGRISPTGSPANATSIMAVGSVDRFLQVSVFSNAPVNIAGPGTCILSSFSRTAAPLPSNCSQAPPGYLQISGTSMATPFVAGIAALIAESHPEYDAADVARGLLLIARPLQASSSDVGVGLVRAPRNDEGT